MFSLFSGLKYSLTERRRKNIVFNLSMNFFPPFTGVPNFILGGKIERRENEIYK